MESFRGIRSLHTSSDGSEVYHHNHYFYADGLSKSETFRTKKKPKVLSLFLDKSFSWGSTKRESGLSGDKFGFMYLDTWKWTPFFFETGFRHEDRKVSAGASYDEGGSLQSLIVITEHLGSFAAYPSVGAVNELWGESSGTIKKMTLDLMVSPPRATSWKRLEDLAENYVTLHCREGVSLSCPRQIESGKPFFGAVDWLVNPLELQRGRRHYDNSGLSSFTLEVFTLASGRQT